MNNAYEEDMHWLYEGYISNHPNPFYEITWHVDTSLTRDTVALHAQKCNFTNVQDTNTTQHISEHLPSSLSFRYLRHIYRFFCSSTSASASSTSASSALSTPIISSISICFSAAATL